jgi:hypothetical protein
MWFVKETLRAVLLSFHVDTIKLRGMAAFQIFELKLACPLTLTKGVVAAFPTPCKSSRSA